MTDNVEYLDGYTKLPIPVERVLTEAVKNVDHEQPVIVIGYDPDGRLYIASSEADACGNLWMLENTKQRLLEFDA